MTAGLPPPARRPLPLARSDLGGLVSVALFGAGAGAFAYWYARLGVLPVVRGSHTLGHFSGFLTAWTRVFLGAALAGCVAGGLGALRRSDRRWVAVLGLALNLLGLAALLVLTRTGSN